MREITEKDLYYERLADDFERLASEYDTRRRVEVLVDEFLSDVGLAGKSVLDVGCGFGAFSRRLHECGADVLTTDLSAELASRAGRSAGTRWCAADALALVDQFGRDRFDVVVSSECVEHTPDPAEAVRQMAAVLKPGGYLSLSTPNVVWQPVVRLASRIGARPFDGYEHFLSWRALRRSVRDGGAEIVRERGLHLFPFQTRLHRTLRWLDGHCQWARPVMINMCVLARKA
ncbi:MAG TPA: methyltransferase domain-containing protein [Planctomycetaceae bacterium]